MRTPNARPIPLLRGRADVEHSLHEVCSFDPSATLAFENNDGPSFNVDIGDGGNSIFRRMPGGKWICPPASDIKFRFPPEMRHQHSKARLATNTESIRSTELMMLVERIKFRKPVMGGAHIGQAY
jgi:hypothetical protein